jgi:hypothetical protein
MSDATANLMLHAGATRCELERLHEAVTPESTNTFSPINHAEFVNMMRDELTVQGYTIDNEEYGVADGRIYIDKEKVIIPDARMFGTFTLKSEAGNKGYDLAVGFRNAHDKSMATGMFLGSRIFVCDNMAYSGEVHIVRKHSPTNMLELPSELADAIAGIKHGAKKQDEVFDGYKDTKISERDFSHLVCEVTKNDILPITKIKSLLHEWDEPTHEEFADHNMFSAFNAVTEVAKSINVMRLPEKMMKLHRVCDSMVFAN